MNPISTHNAFNHQTSQSLAKLLMLGFLGWIALGTPNKAAAATIWNGPPISFSKLGTDDPTLPAHQDRITSSVWITRGSAQGIYNIKTEAGFTHSLSPADTQWANGTTANYQNLSYTDWNSWAKGVNAGPPSTVGVNAVVHLISDDIYIDIRFTSWGTGHDDPGVSYIRATAPASNSPPSVSITNPANGTFLSGPASVTIGALASDTDGTVTNVQFFDGAVSLGNDATSPYGLSTTLGVGVHNLKAVASDNLGATNASSIVTVTVTNSGPGRISIQEQGNNVVLNWSGAFQLQRSPNIFGSNFVDVPGVTNAPFTEANGATSRFYRLRGN